MTKEPVEVNPSVAVLCANPPPDWVAAAKKASGPHAFCRVKIYMNGLAAGVFGKEHAIYPVGAVIVKEKQFGYRDPKSVQASGKLFGGSGKGASTQPAEGDGFGDGVGGMIKRAAGYDSAHGDWEYFYYEDRKKIEHGKMSSCIECHAGEAERDYVFGSWAAGSERK